MESQDEIERIEREQKIQERKALEARIDELSVRLPEVKFNVGWPDSKEWKIKEALSKLPLEESIDLTKRIYRAYLEGVGENAVLATNLLFNGNRKRYIKSREGIPGLIGTLAVEGASREFIIWKGLPCHTNIRPPSDTQRKLRILTVNHHSLDPEKIERYANALMPLKKMGGNYVEAVVENDYLLNMKFRFQR